MKRWMIIITIMILILTINSIAFASDIINVSMNGSNVKVREVPLLVDGQAIKSEVPTFIHIDRTLVPIRFVAESFGAEVLWDQSTKTASVLHGNKVVKLSIDSNKVDVNGQTMGLDNNSIPRLVTFANNDSRTMVPVRFVSEILGYEVGYDEVNRTPYINSKDDNGNEDEVVDLNPEVNEPPIPSLIQINSIQFVKGSTNSGKVAISSDNNLVLIDKFSTTENKVIIDIPNSQMSFPSDSISVNDENISQITYQVSPEDRFTTRVEISLKDQIEYSIYDSFDGKTKYIAFEDNHVDIIKMENVDGKEAIVIKDLADVKYNIMKLKNPERIVIDLMDSTLVNKIYEYDYNLEFINGIRVSQFSGDNNYKIHDRIVRLVFDIEEGIIDPDIKIETNGKDLIIYPATENPVEEISWDYIVYEGNSNEKYFKIENTKRTSYDVEYMPENRRMDITIPMSATKLEEGIINVQDVLVSSIEIRELKKDDDIIISIYFNKDIEFEVLSNNRDKEIEIQLIGKQIPKGNKIVVLDPGHGGSDPGAVSGAIKEKDLNLSVALKTKSRLEGMGYSVIMTRYDDTAVNLQERPQIANRANADVFVSIHHNSLTDPTVYGLETYYCPQYSGEGKTMEQYPLANEIHNSILDATGANNRNIRQQSGFVVIRKTNMPAILIEGGYMSNPNELKLITSDYYQELIADGITKGINNYFEKY